MTSQNPKWRCAGDIKSKIGENVFCYVISIFKQIGILTLFRTLQPHFVIRVKDYVPYLDMLKN